MSGLLYLIPIALFLGLLGLAGFMWAMKSGQFDDLDGAAERILHDDDDEASDAATADPGVKADAAADRASAPNARPPFRRG